MTIKVILTIELDEARAAKQILEKYPVPDTPLKLHLSMLAFNAKLTKAIKRTKGAMYHEQDEGE